MELYELSLLEIIECELYQLIDVSKLIKEYRDKLMDDYNFNHNVLLLACIEEYYLMNELPLLLNKYFMIPKRRFFNKNFKLDFANYRFEYEISFPKGIDRTGKEFLLFKDMIKKVKENTHDLTLGVRMLGVSSEDQLISYINCRYRDFDSRSYLKSNRIKLEFTV